MVTAAHVLGSVTEIPWTGSRSWASRPRANRAWSRGARELACLAPTLCLLMCVLPPSYAIHVGHSPYALKARYFPHQSSSSWCSLQKWNEADNAHQVLRPTLFDPFQWYKLVANEVVICFPSSAIVSFIINLFYELSKYNHPPSIWISQISLFLNVHRFFTFELVIYHFFFAK